MKGRGGTTDNEREGKETEGSLVATRDGGASNGGGTKGGEGLGWMMGNIEIN
ncbi:hypothetical protein HYC85_001562 [Camellia sinensis]|uniref:Uncharacterized protein n=1 Tax=Camellia sinensis TaxID=4442 RepID=A0A7J7I5R1_CAMSI|nr:hypothetical protein HYC85_001562 [Camellia sinensis]